MTQHLTPHVTASPSVVEPLVRYGQDRPLPTLVKGLAGLRPKRLPPMGARISHRNGQSFASPPPRSPSIDEPPASNALSPKRFRLDSLQVLEFFTQVCAEPDASHQLLQPNTIHEHNHERPNPAVTSKDAATPTEAGISAGRCAKDTSSQTEPGQGPTTNNRLMAPLTVIAHGKSFTPTRLSSNTLCRNTTRPRDWRSHAGSPRSPRLRGIACTTLR